MRNTNSNRNIPYRDNFPRDGSTLLPDGSVIFSDGSVILPDGSITSLVEDPPIPPEVQVIDCPIPQNTFTIIDSDNNKLDMNKILFSTGNPKKRMKAYKSFNKTKAMQNYSDYYSNNNFTSNYSPLQSRNPNN